MPAIDLSILNQRQTPAFYADTLANRPAAGFVGRIFVSTDTFAFFRDNGTGWDLIGGPGTGTITGSGATGQIALWDGASTITGDTGLTYNGTDNSLTASKFIVTGGTSSQFLKGDGSLDSNTYNTGSGVAGQVAFFSGTNAITGNNDLFWDNVNGHLGVGTIIPGTALDVKHDQSTVVQLEQETATNDIRIAFINSGVGLWRLGSFYNAGANDFGLFDIAAATQPVTVKRTTGQVLIGTSTVGSGKLVVASSNGDNGVQIVGAAAPSLRIDNAESGPTKRAGFGISTATNNFIQGSADRDFCMFNGSTTASPILFGIYDTTNVAEAARISAARNFLIGTTTDAGQKLQVNGDAAVSRFLNLGFSGSGPTINTAGGLVTVLNMNGGLIFNYQSSVPSPYTQNIIIDIVFGNWGSNPVIALVDLMATLREYATTSGIAYGKIFATSPSTSTFSTFDVSNITTSESSVSASSGGSYTLRITINPTNNTDVFGIYMNIQTGGIGTIVSSITISYA
jgi:hypothetical protein